LFEKKRANFISVGLNESVAFTTCVGALLVGKEETSQPSLAVYPVTFLVA